MTTRAFDAAVTALSEDSWLPTAEETALGREFFARREMVAPRVLPGMPECREATGWVSQHVLWLEDVARLTHGLLEPWRAYLPGSHMVALLEGYADQARAAAPLAARLTRAWQTERPDPCSYQEAVWWEEWQLPEEERQQIDALTHRLIRVGAMVVVAVERGEAACAR
ncbi:hypothetical protein [Streptomyces orinoci]|uniref:Uncharacterized protein n=1 Tax=Streptomyces orinoci TaxID=67339 RepID=A0ABV3JYL7_STRON|nr:hypothetical protein [Streptomyces orinoci]